MISIGGVIQLRRWQGSPRKAVAGCVLAELATTTLLEERGNGERLTGAEWDGEDPPRTRIERGFFDTFRFRTKWGPRFGHTKKLSNRL